MKYFFKFLKYCFLLSIFFVLPALTKAQILKPKTAGVCFRIDDFQDTSKLRRVINLFDKHNLKFTYAANSGIIEAYGQSNYWNLLQGMYQNNHEVADQSPTDVSHYIETPKPEDVRAYAGRPGVDHVTESLRKICLSYTLLNNKGAGDEGKIRINGDTLFSLNNGEFAFSKLINERFTAFFYLPASDKLVALANLFNANANDPDTLVVQNFWKEKINLGVGNNLDYRRITPFDITTTTEGLQIMAEYTLKVFKKYALPPPTTFVHPGGSHPYNTSAKVREALKGLGYSGAATYPVLRNGITDYNPKGLKQYALQGSDFTPEFQTLSDCKKLIAEKYARNQVVVSINHLNTLGSLLSFDDMLANLEELLIWLKARKIPVDTYRNWNIYLNETFYETGTDIFPPLQNDFNGDQLIDGLEVSNPGIIDKINGVPYNAGYCFSPSTSSSIFYTNELCGLTNGKNTISVSTRGGKDQFDYFNLIVYLPEVNQSFQFNVPTNTVAYTERNFDFYVPHGVTYVNISLNYNTDKNAKAFISGFKLRASDRTIVKAQPITLKSNLLIAPINLAPFASCKGFTQAQLVWNVLRLPNLFTAQISGNNQLQLLPKATKFVSGQDSIQLSAIAPNGSADTAWFYINSTIPTICNGQLTYVGIRKDPSSELSYDWAAQFTDPQFINTKDSFIWVRPTADNSYTLTVTKLNNVKENHTLAVKTLPSKIVAWPTETKSFGGANQVTFTLPYENQFQTYFYEYPQTEAKVSFNGKDVIITKSLSFTGNLAVKLFITTPTCEAYQHTLLANTWATGMKAIDKANIQVYPNPSKGVFTLSGLAKGDIHYEVFNMQGRSEAKGEAETHEINLENLANGFYLLRIFDAKQQVYTTRIQKID